MRAGGPCASLALWRPRRTESEFHLRGATSGVRVLCSLRCVVKAWDAESGEALAEYRGATAAELLADCVICLVCELQLAAFALHLLAERGEGAAEPRHASALLGWSSLGAASTPRYLNLCVAASLVAFAISCSYLGGHDWLCEWAASIEEAIPDDRRRQAEGSQRDVPRLNRARRRARLGSGSGRMLFYCGQEDAFDPFYQRLERLESNGVCGPNNGHQCWDCKGLRVPMSESLRLRRFVARLLRGAARFIFVSSVSYCVVPISKIMFFYAACWIVPRFRDVECFSEFTEYGPWLSWLLTVMLCLYFYLIVAVSGVEGDLEHFDRQDLWAFDSWHERAQVKASALNLGLFTRRGRNAFPLGCSLLLQQVGLPLCQVCFLPSRANCAMAYLVVVIPCSTVMLFKELYIFSSANWLHRGVVLCVVWCFLISACDAQELIGPLGGSIPWMLIGLLSITAFTVQQVHGRLQEDRAAHVLMSHG